MGEESENKSAALSVPDDCASTWNYVWDEKLCKTTLKLFKSTVYIPPILALPDPRRYYVCPVEECKKSFDKVYKSQFRVHLKRHLPDSQKPFKCDQPTCNRAFVRYDELTVHKRTHTGERPFGCEQCGKRFARNHHLHKHIYTHIKKILPSEEQCGDDSGTVIDFDSDDPSSNSLIPTDLNGLVKQEIDSETDDEYYPPDFEDINFEPEKITEQYFPAYYSSDLLVHIKQAEADDSEIPINMEVHVKKEIDTETTDDYFGGFEEDEKCEKHIKYEQRMNDESYTSDIAASECMPSNDIEDKTNPTNNTKSKSKSSDDKPHKCCVDGCDMGFKTPYFLKRHSWVHTKVKNYECDQCKKRFLRRDHLAKHMKIHSRIPIIKSSK